MTRRKKVSRVLEKGQQREASLRSISPQLDLGSGLTLNAYSNRLQNLQNLISTYNTTLSLLDKLADDIANEEQDVRDYSEQMLMGVAVKYGKSSQEYGMAGGVRKNKRRRPTPAPTLSAQQIQRVATPATNGKVTESTNGKALVV
jgi:DNA repair ATPase RecN